MIAAVSMGLSVDSSLHYLTRYRRELKAGKSSRDALRASQGEIGLAVVLSTIALVIGFGSLATSDFLPTVAFGSMAALTMIGGLLGNLILLPAMINDAGETSTYPTGRTPLRSVLYRVDHCIVTGNTMMVIDESGSSVLKLWPGDANWNEAKPAILKRRKAPPGPFYTVTSNGHFYHFFASDVIPLLYFLRKHGAEIGPMTIVTKSSYPPYVDHTLRAICSTYQNIDIVEIDRTERLMM